MLPALAICHYDPDTLEDRAAERRGRTCYECPLDYGSQPDRRIPDRALKVGSLELPDYST